MRTRLLALRGFVAALLLIPSLALAQATDPTGHWQGAIRLPGQELAIDIDLGPTSGGGWKGDISIPAQMIRDLGLTILEVTPPKVRVEIPGIPGQPTFDGALSADGAKIAGTFTQGGASFPFELVRSAPATEKATQALEGFEAWVDAALAAWDVPALGLAIVKDGQVILVRGFGQRDREAGLPATENTLFAIGSSSKAFTTFVLATLVEEGKVEWDRPVERYLPSFHLHDRTATELITPRDLVTHRSGLPRHDAVWYNNQALSRAELVTRLEHLEPTATLRQRFQYNNLMYLTAGYLIEQVTGESWEANVRSRIFGPLGMAGSNFDVADSQQAADFAWPYEERDDKVVRVPFRPIGNMGPAGSINSSAKEMAEWVKLHLGNGKVGDRQLIQPASLTELHTPQIPLGNTPERPEIGTTSYALGWMVDTYRGRLRLHHGGAIDGFSAMVSLLPQDGIGIVALANKGGTRVPELVIRHAYDRLLGLPPIDWNGEALARRAASEKLEEEAKEKKAASRRTGTRPAHELAEYAGDYSHPGYGPLSVRVAGKALEVTYNRIVAPLEHWHYEVWRVPEGAKDPVLEGLQFRFDGDMAGNVAAIATQLEPTLGEVSFQRQVDARYSDSAFLARLAGDYELAGEVITISVSGRELLLSQRGGTPLHLEAVVGGEFKIKEVPIITIRFEVPAEGPATALISTQPNGVFTATRKK
ncbi:MAG TPA: serine hydrolase [Thermoanaerobaculia bacterium]|nr:serine hydrolase [Thermoanaerobaculia bacterium]